MSSFLAQGLTDHGDETFFKGIIRVPAKTNVSVDLNTLNRVDRRYWNYPKVIHSDEGEAEEEFRRLLADSVRLRLRSDVKVGVLLSGGLDSSAIACLANQLSTDNIEMYSIVSTDDKYSEERFIDALTVSGYLRTRKIPFHPADALDSLAAALYHNDEPFGSLSIIAQYKLFQVVRQETDATVLLSGQGGDELGLGYIKYFFFYLRALMVEGRYCSALGQIASSLCRQTLLKQFSIGSARRYIRRLDNFRTIIRPEYHFIERMHCRDMRQIQMDDLDSYSVPALARYEDRNSMAHSLETRHPFLDHRLVEFAVNLPTEEKLRDGWTKYIVRKGFPELPACVRWRRDKKGFTTPEEQWIRGQFAPLISGYFHGSRLGEIGMIAENRFLEYYESFRKGGRISFNDISRVFIAEMWLRQHF
jgi:asparagine synthase (glutamine-hydrolysing)